MIVEDNILNYSSPEHLIAPRLELDVEAFNREVRFGHRDLDTTQSEHENTILNHWSKIFLSYFKEWNGLIFYFRDMEFSFWIKQFSTAYFFVVQHEKLPLSYFSPTEKYSEEWFIKQILIQLKKFFRTTGFIEQLNVQNEQYSKGIDRVRTAYQEVSKQSVDAPELKFYLTYPPAYQSFFCISEVTKAINNFEKLLKGKPWYQGQVLFTYYHFIRDSRTSCYVIHLYLAFQKVFFSSEVDYLDLVTNLWQQATRDVGVVQGLSELNNPFCLEEGELIEYVEPDNILDDLNDVPESVSSVSEGMSKICIYPKGFKTFKGRKV